MDRLLQPFPIKEKRYKVYFVEEDDEYRERVMEGTVKSISVRTESDFGDIQVNQLLDSAMIFQSRQRFILEETEFVPDEKGRYVTITDFNKIEDREREEEENEDYGF